MYELLIELIEKIEINNRDLDIINWGSPIPFFGNIYESTIATVGLNPSNKEFVDDFGNELYGTSRRFHTLHSLGIDSWSDLDSRHLMMILDSCIEYFKKNPYDLWFRKLDKIISKTKFSYYSNTYISCHLDIVPYATNQKWSDINNYQKSSLIEISKKTIALSIRDSKIKILILNGQSVVNYFEMLSNIRLQYKEMKNWSLIRRSNRNISGISYIGVIDSLQGVNLEREVVVLGYNHNIQSSYGITSQIIQSISEWVAETLKEEV